MEGIGERVFETPRGSIHYWVSWASPQRDGAANIVFLPGLTADHRLFEKQMQHFKAKTNCLVWDPPSHGASRPFELTWNMGDLADWLSGVMEAESLENPILVGQSMGGYVAQAYMEKHPGKVSGFVSIDSAPLARCFYSSWELALLKHMHAVYSIIPWPLLVRWGCGGCATTEYGRALMRKMMEGYRKAEYVDLAAHGYRVLATAVEGSQGFKIDCSVVLLCGSKDRAGSSRRYNRAWAQKAHVPLVWLEGAGHNSNTDAPDAVNLILDDAIRDMGQGEA